MGIKHSNLFISGDELAEGALGLLHSVISDFLGEEELHGSLNVVGSQSPLLLVSDQLRGLDGDLLEHVGHQRVDDGHALFGDTDVGAVVFEDLVDVEREGLEVLAMFFVTLSFVSTSFTVSHYYQKIGRGICSKRSDTLNSIGSFFG